MLELKNINAGYGTFQALFDVSLSIKAGEAIAVIGPNGAGKTTLLRVMSRLLEASAGDMVMEGRSYRDLPSHEVVGLGIAQVSEGRRLFPRLTVEDNLKMGAYTPAARAKRLEKLDYVYSLFPRMAERRYQLAGTMSGGEQQMLATGRGLMGEPRLLIMDEPSLGLSPMMVQEMFAMIKRIRGEGVTVILIEQNVVQSLAIADRAYVLENGSFSLSGNAVEIASNPRLKKAYLGL